MKENLNSLVLDKEEFEKLDYCQSFKGAIEDYYGSKAVVKEVIIIMKQDF